MADSKGVQLHAMGGAASPSRAMTYGELKAMREAREAREAAEAAAAAAPAPAAAAAGASAASDLVLTPSSGSPSPQHAPATPPGTRVGTGVSASAQRAAAAAGPSAAPTPARPLLLEPVNGRAAAAGGASAPSSVHMELSAPALTHRPTMARSDEEAQLIGTLLTAAARNDLKRVEELITSRGVDANAGDYDRRTALHLASAEGHLVLVRLLVEKLGARVDVKDRFGHLPLDDAILHEHPTVVNFLRSRNAASGVLSRHQAELLVAASNGDCATVEKLLSMGVQPNCIGHDRRTPLHLAVADGRADVVELLLKAGADRHAHDRFHQTPADEAKQRAVRSGADPIHELFVQYTPEREREEAAKHRPCCSKFVFWFGWWEALIIVLFGVLADYAHESKGAVDPTTDEAANAITRIYPLYQDIHVMIFIGFGYLMTFLRKNGYSAVGYTFLVCAFVIQWYTLVEAFWGALFHGDWSTPVELNIRKLILSDFAGGAVMITYGAVLGKVSPLQLLFCAGFEVIFYALNERISLEMQIADIGGSMVIHMFGAFFGLAFSRMVTPLDKAKGNANNSAGYHSDIFAMIGTVFLWLFWPSFNGGLATGNTQHRAIVNTVLSLAGSCVAACVASYAVRRETRFNMVDVQNATLAGGVAMGTCADMLITPGAAIAIGAISGFVSVVGYVYVQPFLEHHISLHDTCGVNNLHGMPSIIGALAGVIASYEASVDKYGEQLPVIFPARMADGSGRSANDQAARQFAYIIITLSIAIASGTLVGAVVSRKEFDPPSDSLFLDAQYWEVPSKEEPYYFDARGEIAGHILQPAALRNRSATQVEQDAAAALQDMHPKLSHKHLEQRIEQLETQLAASYSRPGAAAAPAGGSVEQLAHTLQQVLEHLNKRA